MRNTKKSQKNFLDQVKEAKILLSVLPPLLVKYVTTVREPLVAQMVKNLLQYGKSGFNPGSGNPLEKGMATHPSVVAWRSLWTEVAGELQSMGLLRVEQDWEANT